MATAAEETEVVDGTQRIIMLWLIPALTLKGGGVLEFQGLGVSGEQKNHSLIITYHF